MKREFSTRRAMRHRGSTLVEFGLVAPLILIFFMAIMDFGWLAKNNLQMNNAVREGARLLSIGSSTQAVSDLVRRRCSPLTVDITIDYTLDRGATYTPVAINSTSPNQIPTTALSRVTAINTYRPLTGVLPWLRGSRLRQRAEFGRE
jgi:Flp pilus assembly protein TadG